MSNRLLYQNWLTATEPYSMPIKDFLLMAFGVNAYRQISIDHDVCAPENLARRLELMTGQTANKFECMQQITQRALSWPSTAWLHDNLHYARRRSNFCIECLHSDTVPYFRNIWRYASIGRCEIHQINLATACPHCRLSISPARYVPSKKSNHMILGQCPYCNEYLYESSQNGKKPIFSGISHRKISPPKPNEQDTAEALPKGVTGNNAACSSKHKHHGIESEKPIRLHEKILALDLGTHALTNFDDVTEKLKLYVENPKLRWLATIDDKQD